MCWVSFVKVSLAGCMNLADYEKLFRKACQSDLVGVCQTRTTVFSLDRRSLEFLTKLPKNRQLDATDN